MKRLTPIRLSVGLVALLSAQGSWAGGTDAGTLVENTATLSYSVGGQSQAPITSPTADFVVDEKIDLTVTGDSGSNVIVNPSTTGNVLTYKLKNEGNDTQEFQIDVSHLTTDDFNAGEGTETAPTAPVACTYQVDGGTATALNSSSTVTLAKDAESTITVTCTMPNRPDVDDGHLSTIDVLATALEGSSPAVETGATDGSDREDEIDIVLADGTGTATDGADRNAKHSDTQTFEINAPMLSLTKESAVVSDPVNGTTDPKRIPGAIIEYTITIQNTSDAAATGVEITDPIQNEDVAVNYVGSLVVPSGASGNFDDNTDELSVTGITVPAGTTTAPGEATITFQVEIL